MEKPYQPPNVLRLFGITLKEWTPIEDVADKRLLRQAADGHSGAAAPESDQPYDKVPHHFTRIEEWPLRTNIRCWQCGCTFDDRPKFVPTYVREAENGGIEFGVRGNMCTFNCAELWIQIHYAGKVDQRWRIQDNLCLVYFLFTGHRATCILPAPHKTELRQYGGELDEEAFWKKMRSLDSFAGLRDHTPGSVVPDRDRTPAVPECDRVKIALATLRAQGGFHGRAMIAGAAPDAVEQDSVWAACAPPRPSGNWAADAEAAGAEAADAEAAGAEAVDAEAAGAEAADAEAAGAEAADAEAADAEAAGAEAAGAEAAGAEAAGADADDILEILLAGNGNGDGADAVDTVLADDTLEALLVGSNNADSGGVGKPPPQVSDADMDDLLAELGVFYPA